MGRATHPPSRLQMNRPRQNGGAGVGEAAKVRYQASSNGSGHGPGVGEIRSRRMNRRELPTSATGAAEEPVIRHLGRQAKRERVLLKEMPKDPSTKAGRQLLSE